MGNKVAAAALQYSKWLSRFISWIWALYRFTVLIVAAIQPSVAESMAATTAGVDTIMLVNISTYLVNSLGEKWIYSDRMVLKWLDKGGFKHLISHIATRAFSKNEIDDEDEKKDENLTEEENNEEEIIEENNG